MLGGAGSVAARRRPAAAPAFLSWPCFAGTLLLIVLFQFWSRSASSIDCQNELTAARKALQFRDDRLDVMAAQLRTAKETVERLRSRRAAEAPKPQDAAQQATDHATGAWADAGSGQEAAAVAATSTAASQEPAAAVAPTVLPRLAVGLEPAPADPRQARALLVICYNRPDYLRRTLTSVLERLPAYNRPHVYISQDGAVPGVTAVINEMKAAFAARAPDIPFTHLQHTQDLSNAARQWGGYYALAQHFGWALGQVLGAPGGGDNGSGRHPHPRAIILEDDLDVAPDFFDYFSAVEPLLDEDRTLLAASAWSDLGQAAYTSPDAPPAVAAAGAARVHRSDFFPGLGWMLTRHAWEELGPKWPAGFWDDWLREPAQRSGRAFLRPEISRSYTFGQEGVSQAQFFAQYLGNIRLNDRKVDWAAADLRYLAPTAYDAALRTAVAAARSVSYGEVVSVSCKPKAAVVDAATVAAVQPFGGLDGADDFEAVKATYSGFDGPGGYSQLAKMFGFIDDVKANVPRAAYHGVTTVIHNGCRKFLVDSSKEAQL